MVVKTELHETEDQVLIVSKTVSPLVEKIRDGLKKYGSSVFVTPTLPPDLERFDLYFFVNEGKHIDTFLNHPHKKLIFIFVKQVAKAQHLTDFIQKYGKKNVKVISLSTSDPSPDEVDKIFWFVFSHSSEVHLGMESVKMERKHHKAPKTLPSSFTFPKISVRRAVVLAIAFVLFLHIIFIPPLLASIAYNYRAGKALVAKDASLSTREVGKARRALSASRSLFGIARPMFLLFGIVIHAENMFELSRSASDSVETGARLMEDGKRLVALLTDKGKSEDEIAQTKALLTSMQEEVGDIEDSLSVVYQKTPDWPPQVKQARAELKDGLTTMSSFRSYLPHLTEILTSRTEKRFLLLFANNMEIRPGGGFIGSFGILTLKDATISDLKVYDVYDADGQLNIHVDPPRAISQHLDQPHWFLRDSAFSPDFVDNYNQAKYFLGEEMGLSTFDGGILLTTTAIQNILEATGNLYIPDFKEIVNKDNFYLKAQLYAEKDFFPGSQQKKRFLAAIMNQLLINLENSSLPLLLKMVRKSLDEKQLVLYSEDPSLQSLIDSTYWSGRMILPQCASATDNCITDYIFPVDANLGVNKANFFVSRTINLDAEITNKGVIKNRLTVNIKNGSANEAFPGGRYKNYFQAYLPKESYIKLITKNDVLVEDFDQKEGNYKSVGFLIEIKPQETAKIVIDYELAHTLKPGQGAYQLIVQKQIGSPNSDVSFSVTFPKNVYIVNQNFTPLVKGNTIIYNTNLSADKIFFVDVIQEAYGQDQNN